MGATPVSEQSTAPSVDSADVQGLVRFGHGRLKEACYLLLRIRDAAAARSWCAAAPVTTAALQEHPPGTALQVAFSAAGLRALDLPAGVLEGFSPEFQSGMAGEESRSRRLGDIGANAPQNWEWGQPGSEPDVVVMLFAAQDQLAAFRAKVEDAAFQAAFETIWSLPTNDFEGYEPFGFKDGISQPEVDWQRQRSPSQDELTYTNLVALGEFLLGYPNEYGKYTTRPLLDAGAKGADGLLPAEDQPGKKDLGRNGAYVVLRTLEQDVRGFWKFLDAAAKSDASERARLGSAAVGRTTEGEPLVPLSQTAIPGITVKPGDPPNRFTFDADPNGTRCPFGSHIRRVNPRNVDLPGHPEWFLAHLMQMLALTPPTFRGDIMASTRFHRILRRGREYGVRLSVEEALKPAPPDEPRSGLHFLCVNANITRQFEFVQNAWVMSTKFDGLSEESDPLLGNRAAVGDCPYTGNFSMPREGAPPRVLTDMPPFITVRGGGYFFLPSVRALRYFGTGPHS